MIEKLTRRVILLPDNHREVRVLCQGGCRRVELGQVKLASAEKAMDKKINDYPGFHLDSLSMNALRSVRLISLKTSALFPRSFRLVQHFQIRGLRSFVPRLQMVQWQTSRLFRSDPRKRKEREKRRELIDAGCLRGC